LEGYDRERERVTVVKFRMNDGAGCFEVKVWADTAKFTDVIVAILRDEMTSTARYLTKTNNPKLYCVHFRITKNFVNVMLTTKRETAGHWVKIEVRRVSGRLSRPNAGVIGPLDSGDLAI